MAYTELRFRDETRTKLLAGASALADAARSTLGPESRSVLIEKKCRSPLVCDDGVTIAKAVKLKDPVENLGAQLLRDAAVQTSERVGDGTTTTKVVRVAPENAVGVAGTLLLAEVTLVEIEEPADRTSTPADFE